jgi:outer membrane protein TolC
VSLYAAENMQQQYQAGSTGLLAWLIAEQQAMQSQVALLGAQSRLLQHSVALHKALGGGWLLLEQSENN